MVVRAASPPYGFGTKILVNPAGVVTTALDVAVERELTHVAGFLDREVVATCLLVPEAEAVRTKRVAVASSLQGGGIGTRMLRFCEAHARSIGAYALTAHAREPRFRST